MDIINTTQNKFLEYRSKMNEAESKGDKEREKQYFFQEAAVCAVETEIWTLYDAWEKINKEVMEKRNKIADEMIKEQKRKEQEQEQ